MPESRKDRAFRQREEEILATALELFHTSGIDSVTVAEIAKATDIGKGTIYKHFSCKDEIFARLAIDFLQDMFASAAAQDPKTDCFDRMKSMFGVCFYKHVEYPIHSEIALRCETPEFRENLSEPLRQAFGQLNQDFYTMVGEMVAQGIANKDLPDMPIEELLCGTHATFTGALQMLRTRDCNCFDHTESLSQERFIELIIDFTMAGLFGLKKQAQA